jgi:hypothetical protein
MPYDYSDAPAPNFDLVPHGTHATLSLHIRAGGAGEDGMLKRTKAGDAEMLDIEFIVVDGPYKGRKFWEYLILSGTTDGHAKSVDINRGTLKAIIDSAKGLKPDDIGVEARAARTVSLKDFEGMTFIGRIGVEKGKAKADGSGDWPDKNILAAVITPDKKDWHPVEQQPPFNGGGGASTTPSTPALPISRPGWAT